MTISTENCIEAFETSVVCLYYQRLASIAHRTKERLKNKKHVSRAILAYLEPHQTF